MLISEYLEYLSKLDMFELKQERTDLEKKLEMVKTVLHLTEAEHAPASAERESETRQPLSSPLRGTTVITDNDYRYGMLRFANDTPIAQQLEKGSSVAICYQDQTFSCSVPQLENYPSMRGRINGLLKLYRRFPEFEDHRTVDVEYDFEAKRLTILRAHG